MISRAEIELAAAHRYAKQAPALQRKRLIDKQKFLEQKA